MRIPPAFASKSYRKERLALVAVALAPGPATEAGWILPDAEILLLAGMLTVKGSTTRFRIWIPPRIARTTSGAGKPGTVQRPPELENAASSSARGQPRKPAAPVKYCSARISS